MTHERYSESDNWEVESEDHDVRGWSVVDDRGQPLGTVSDMVVDTQTETIDRLLLDNGSEVPVADVLIQDGTVRLGGTAMSTGAGMAGGTAAGYTTTERMAGTDAGYTRTDPMAGTDAGYARTDPMAGTDAGLAGTDTTRTADDAWRIRRHQSGTGYRRDAAGTRTTNEPREGGDIE